MQIVEVPTLIIPKRLEFKSKRSKSHYHRGLEGIEDDVLRLDSRDYSVHLGSLHRHADAQTIGEDLVISMFPLEDFSVLKTFFKEDGFQVFSFKRGHRLSVFVIPKHMVDWKEGDKVICEYQEQN